MLLLVRDRRGEWPRHVPRLLLVIVDHCSEDEVHQEEEAEKQKGNEEDACGARGLVEREHHVGEVGGREQGEEREQRLRKGLERVLEAL